LIHEPAIGNKAIGNKNALLSLDMVGIKPLPKFFHQVLPMKRTFFGLLSATFVLGAVLVIVFFIFSFLI
jgi:hypothetical protein